MDNENTRGPEPQLELPDLRSFTPTEIDNWFTYHPPTAEQLVCYQEIREAGRQFAIILNHTVPAGADKSAAIRLLRETVMTANAGIACHVPRGKTQTALG